MKTLRVVSFVMLLLLTIILLPGASAQEIAYQEDFEDGQAQDWTLEPGWGVIQVDGNYVLSGEGHTWARASGFYDDFRLSFRLMLRQGEVHLNVRTNDAGRYFIRFYDQGSQLGKQYWPDTFQQNLARGSGSHRFNEWHQVEISANGNELTFSVDGNVEWTYVDPEPLLVGGFSFESLDNTQVLVDEIEVVLADTSAYAIDESTSALTWTRTGGPLGGLGYDIRMTPGDPDRMLVSDAWAGVFASTNGGATWSPSNSGITIRTGGTGDAIPIFCLSIDPVHPNIVWVGTQNLRGIFKSTDGGATWIKKDQGVVERDGITFRGFTVDPTNSDVVYAAAEVASWNWNHGQYRGGREFEMVAGVVYKTTDGGEHWTAIWRGDNLARYVWIDPRDTNVLYISTGIFDREAANSDPQTGAPGGEGVLKSTDGGRTWMHVNNGLDNLYVGSLFMHPADPEVLIAGAGNVQYRDHAGVYLSTDGGATWTQTLGTDEGEPIDSVEISTSNPQIAYAAGAASVFRSEDGGRTWERVAGESEGGWGPPGVRAGFPIDLQVDPRNPERIFANAYGGGNFLSEDGGRTWVDASRGYTGAQVRAIAVDPDQPGRVIAAARSGIFVSQDGGVTWAGLNYPPAVSMEWNAVALDPQDPQHLVAETNWGNRLINSRDGGTNWARVFDFNDQRVGWGSIAFAPSDPRVLYAGSTGYTTASMFDPTQPGHGIFVSNDNGQNWTPANNTLSQDASVVGLAVSPQNPHIVFAATTNHGLLMTVDGGGDWHSVQGGLPQSGGASVAIDPRDSSLVLSGFARQALYRSLDGGETWEASSRGMNPEAQINSIIFDPTSPGEVIYAADVFSGVYRSVDGGRTWSAINNGLLMRSVNALALSSDGLHLYAATEGGGVYRLDLNGEPPAPVSEPASAEMPAPATEVGGIPAATPAPSQPTGQLPAWLIPSAVGIVVFLALVLFWFARKRRARPGG